MGHFLLPRGLQGHKCLPELYTLADMDAIVSGYPLTGFFQDYAGTSWTGTASGGVSGGRVITHATLPPTVGTPLNGHGTALYAAGGTHFLFNNDVVSTWLSATAWTVWVVVVASAPLTNKFSLISNGGPQGIGLGFASNTQLNAAQYDGAYKSAISITTTPGSYMFIQGRYDGTNIQSRVNRGAWVSTAVGNPTAAVLAEKLQFGRTMVGEIAEYATSQAVLTDDQLNIAISRAEKRYGLTF